MICTITSYFEKRNLPWHIRHQIWKKEKKFGNHYTLLQITPELLK
ncbi:MAG: hypothetical protein RJA07_718 [Bacteroidota bacterium]|jgi:hypothetical protein